MELLIDAGANVDMQEELRFQRESLFPNSIKLITPINGGEVIPILVRKVQKATMKDQSSKTRLDEQLIANY